MTDTITTSPGPQAGQPPLAIDSLVRAICDLLTWEADDLPRPIYITVYGCTQHISLQFEPDPSSYEAIAQWAARFGGTVTHRPIRREDGPAVICGVEFDANSFLYGVGVRAEAFAVISHTEETVTDE
jgi:hypothetical protein